MLAAWQEFTCGLGAKKDEGTTRNGIFVFGRANGTKASHGMLYYAGYAEVDLCLVRAKTTFRELDVSQNYIL